MAIDFQRVAASLLARSLALCAEWLPQGKKIGNEWVAGNLHGDAGRSLSINLTTGQWGDFSADIKGGDLVSLYAAIHGLEQNAAARKLCPELCNGSTGEAPIVASKPVAILLRPPANAPSLPAHHELGEHVQCWAYHDKNGDLLYYVARYQTENGKDYRPWSWSGHRWIAKAAPEPRALYGLNHLDDRPVLIVEGEKCADAAALLTKYTAVTWSGGAKGVARSDWSVLGGRSVDLWPDNDKPGRDGMAELAKILLGLNCTVRVANPGKDEPEKWDIADAIEEGWSVEQILGWIEDHAATTKRPDKEPKRDRSQLNYAPSSAIGMYQSLGLACNGKGVPFPTMANAAIIIQSHPRTKDHIWFDSFRQKIFHNLHGVDAPWTDADDRALSVWIQQAMQLPKFTLGLMREAVMHAAMTNQRNSVVEWLTSLEWDGIERQDKWLSDCLGVPLNDYSMAVARNWPLSMVARAFRPGCQVDHMPILEGKMGHGKSSFLRLLGGEWYSALPDAFGSKDFLQGILGQWLIEVPDLSGFNRRDHQQILAIITTPVDRYRASYGRHTEDHPRTCIFTATSETDEYLQDAKGRRRFWPLRCESIDLDALASRRDQLFAEAFQVFKRGDAKWHEVPLDADEQQLERVEEDTWSERVLAYVNGNMRDYYGEPITPILTSAAILNQIGVELKDQSDGQKRRIKGIMTANGWELKVVKIDGHSVKRWRKEN